MTLVHKSEGAEGVWCILHTDRGPFLLGALYRPPGSGERSISSFVEEHSKLSDVTMGVLLLGDINVHHKSWLKHSTGTAPEGETMRAAAADMGFKQRVKKLREGLTC